MSAPQIFSILIVVFLTIINPWSAYAKEPLLDYLHTLAPPGSHAITAPSASVTLVTFEDYQCEACAHTHKILKELMRLYPGQINFVFRHYPLTEHRNAMKAAVAVEAAAAQGKFIEMHDKLLENQSEWVNSPDPTNDFERYGRLFGPLTIPDPFEKDFEEYTAIIKKDEADAKELDVKGVPTTFVNGRNIGYVSDVDVIRKEIEKDILPVSIKFTPKAIGVKTGSVTITGNASTATAVNLTSKLPIKIIYESEGKTREQTIPADPITNTSSASGMLSTVLTGGSDFVITVYDSGGEEIAIYNGGVGSPDPLWHWSLLEKQWNEQERRNLFNLKNPQLIFVILFLLLLIPAAKWIWLGSPMVKIAAISGLIIAGATIAIFMAPNGLCDDPSKLPEPNAPLSGRGGASVISDPLDWIKERKCGLTKPYDSSKKVQSNPSTSLTPSVDSKDLAPSSSISTIFRFNSHDESRATELKLESLVYKDHPVKKFNPYLPIKVDLETDGNIVWQGVITASDCHDKEKVPYCEVKGYVNNRAWWKDGLKLRAYDKNGKRVAYLDYKVVNKGK